MKTYKEQRLLLLENGRCIRAVAKPLARVVFSGQADVIVIDGNRAMVADFKTGRGEQTHATDNEQLRALAALVHLAFGVESVRVAIIQPWAGAPTVADFDLESLKGAFAWVKMMLQTASRAGEKMARAGDWCEWCKAKPTCPAWTSEARKVADMQIIPSDSQLASTYTADDLWQIDERISRMIRQGEKARAWVQAMVLANPEKFAGKFTVEESTGRTTITDLQRVWERLNADGVAHEAFLACLTARKDDSKASGLPGLRGLIKRAYTYKGKAVDTKLAEVLAGCETPGQTKLVAKRIGDTEEIAL